MNPLQSFNKSHPSHGWAQL